MRNLKNRIFRISSILLLVVVITACQNNSQSSKNEKKQDLTNIEDANFIIGSWINTQPDGHISEVWGKIDDSTMYGITFFVKGVDTVSFEEILLVRREKNLLYIPKVSDQNENKPVVFTRIKSRPDRLVFENTEHDFPQKIVYMKISKDSIFAEISGKIDGKEKYVNFPMAREK